MRQTALRVGHHFLNSFIQLARVDLGTSTMWGPLTFLKCFMKPRSEIVCRVFPRPISSA